MRPAILMPTNLVAAVGFKNAVYFAFSVVVHSDCPLLERVDLCRGEELPNIHGVYGSGGTGTGRYGPFV